MALDRAVQVACDAGEAPPTLRLYTWERPTVTLGRFQRVDGIDRALCDELGIDVVRRFTGGRGVLHDDEITYSLVAGIVDDVPRGVAASYRHLCTALACAYGLLGVEAQLTARPRGEGSSPACYLHATAADLSLGAMKLSGSAQVWFGDTVMQHGSFTITRDVGREARIFGLDETATERLAAETVTLADALGHAVTPDTVRQAVIDGVAQALGVELVPGQVSEKERDIARGLLPRTDPDAPVERSVRPSR